MPFFLCIRKTREPASFCFRGPQSVVELRKKRERLGGLGSSLGDILNVKKTPEITPGQLVFLPGFAPAVLAASEPTAG